MKENHREAMVILEEAAAADFGADVQTVQSLPPRVYVVAAAEAALQRLRQTPGVVSVLEKTAPPSSLPALNEGEKLFAQAWLTPPKTAARKGEGLTWDDPRFQPPA